MNQLTSPPFDPGRRQPCFCGSGDKFKDCCGSAVAVREPPHGIFVQHHALKTTQCQKLVSLGEASPKEWVGTVDSVTGKVGGKEDDSRVTKQVILGENQAELDKLVQKMWLQVIEPELGVRMEWFEQPVMLHYSPGGHYASHADAEYFDTASGLWHRQMDRDLSLLLYINEDFEGGQINFTHFRYRYAPSVGDLVVFPSDHRYKHQAEKVTSGTRYCIVSWGAVEGAPRANAKPPFNALKFKRGWFSR